MSERVETAPRAAASSAASQAAPRAAASSAASRVAASSAATPFDVATPRVKFCGLSHLEDAPAVNAIGPDYVGFVFWPRSKRCVTPAEARALRSALDARIKTVGVFVDEEVETIADLVRDGIISVAQLHGSESESFIARLRESAASVEVWKAFEVHDRSDVSAANRSSADLVLLDAGKGCGQAFDWSLLTALERPFALAGGLDPSTLARALASIPRGATLAVVDVSSGIEAEVSDDTSDKREASASASSTAASAVTSTSVSASEGTATPADRRPHKDPEKMQQFMDCLRQTRKGQV